MERDVLPMLAAQQHFGGETGIVDIIVAH